MKTPVIYGDDEKFEIGGLKVLRQSSDDQAVVVGAGVTAHEALKAHEILKKQGISVAVVDLYSVKPLDEKTLVELAKNAGNRVLTVEDHYVAGGLGEAVASALAKYGVHVYTRGVSEIPGSGSPEEQMKAAGIDADSIVEHIHQLS